MSSEEKKKILQMVEDGKITAEEAMTLIKAIEEASADAGIEVLEAGAPFGDASGPGSGYDADEFEEVKARARSFASIPLGIGILMTVLAGYWMFALTQNSNFGFWFFSVQVRILSHFQCVKTIYSDDNCSKYERSENLLL